MWMRRQIGRLHARHHAPLLFAGGILAGLAIGLAVKSPHQDDDMPALEAIVIPQAPVEKTNGLRLKASSPAAQPVAVTYEASPHRLGPVERADLTPARPKLAIVIDDLGLDRAAFEAVNALPGQLTLSFLPYGAEAQSMLNAIDPRHEAMLHLPMEPRVLKDLAGPDMLRVADDPVTVKAQLARNLGKLYGYKGVNNHTGSRFTADAERMAVVLEQLDNRGLFFLDSLTTGRAVAAQIAGDLGARVIERDFFLDADHARLSVAGVIAQLEAAAMRAEDQGAAIVIGHPYPETLAALADWLPQAEARGIELVTASELAPPRPALLLAGLR